MESGIQSSFIPKDAGKAVVPPRLERSGGLQDLIFLISIVLLVASGALAGAVFLYKQYLATEAASRVQQLKTAQNAFEPQLIQEITRLNDRMRVADQVLGAHLAPTALFQMLSQSTLRTIAFSSFELDASDPTKITVKMQGIARSVNSIALEADLLSKNGLFANPIFSGISRQADGVHFEVSMLVNPAAMNYVSLAGAAAATQSSQGNPQPSTDSAAPSSTPDQRAPADATGGATPAAPDQATPQQMPAATPVPAAATPKQRSSAPAAPKVTTPQN